MKNQNRIALRILTEARRANRAVCALKPIHFSSEEMTNLLSRLGANLPGVELRTTAYMEQGEVQELSLEFRTLSHPYLKKTLHLNSVEDLGEEISWAMNEIANGRAENVSSPEQDYRTYLEKQSDSQDYDSFEDQSWHEDIA